MNYPKPIIILAALIITFAAGCMFGIQVFSPSSRGSVNTARLVAEPYSIKDWQQFLKDEGYYHGKIDGHLSDDWKNSKTQKAWDGWYNDKMGIATFELELK